MLKIKIKLKYILIAVVAVVFFLILILILLFSKVNEIQNKIFVKSNTTPLISGTGHKTLADYFYTKTPFNILLLGYGGGNHDGAYLTDSMIVAHVDPSSNSVTLISIPRDIWVKIPTNGQDGSFWKINAAYELGLDDQAYPNKLTQFKGKGGGGELVKYTVGQVTGLQIDRFVALDFNGFKKSIDTLGGVDINVEKTFDDLEYPIDGKEDDLCGHPVTDLPQLEQIATISATQAFPCRYIHLHFDQGTQHMDGERALAYVRSRHSLQDGTDFGRSKRQRNLLVAVEKEVFDVGFIPKAIPFTDSLQDDLSTDLSLDEVKALMDKSDTFKTYKVNNLALTDQNVLVGSWSNDGQYILKPSGESDNWNSVHSFIASGLDPTKLTLSPSIMVENGTSIAGLAALAANRLQDKDYNILTPANFNGDLQKTTSIIIYKPNLDPQITNDLKKEFGVQNIKYAQQSDTNYDILIIVGQDYNLLQGKKMIN